MRKDNSIVIKFEVVDGLKIPFLFYKGEIIKINTLHIHSKRLYLFLS